MIASSTKHIIKEVVQEITKEADKLMSEEKNDFTYGQRLAYAETISILQSACAGEDLKELGLDFDPDSRYL